MRRGLQLWGSRAAAGLLLAASSQARADERSCAPEGTAQPAFGAVALEVSRGPGFGLVRDAHAMAELACAPPSLAQNALVKRIERAQLELGVDAQLVVLLSTSPVSCNAIYYLPIANDVRGIGYVHSDPRELFDDSPESRLEGIAFLNDWPYWQERRDEFRGAFNHELGHRWGARVHALIDGAPSAEWLGREQSHWSYFLSSEGSCHEGNVWQADGSVYRTETPRHPWEFSTLDLYLMGVAPAAEVQPLTLLRPELGAAEDCRGDSLSFASPPQGCGSLSLSGAATTVAIEDVIAVEGPRVPEAVSERELDVLVLVLEAAHAPLEQESCERLELDLRARLHDFETAARGRVKLRDVLSQDGSSAASCSELTVSEAPPCAASRAATCAFQAQRRRAPSMLAAITCCLLLAGRRMRRRAHETSAASHERIRVWISSPTPEQPGRPLLAAVTKTAAD